MTAKNLKQFVENLDYPKKYFYREVRGKIGVSLSTIDQWAKFDSKTRKPEYLEALSEITGIPQEDLFKKIDKEGV